MDLSATRFSNSTLRYMYLYLLRRVLLVTFDEKIIVRAEEIKGSKGKVDDEDASNQLQRPIVLSTGNATDSRRYRSL